MPVILHLSALNSAEVLTRIQVQLFLYALGLFAWLAGSSASHPSVILSRATWKYYGSQSEKGM